MMTIVVGGHSRKVGKTSVAAGLIKAFSQYSWTAVKLTTHWHPDSPAGEVCSIVEETSRKGKSDSARYLAAGAARSFWIRMREERSEEAFPILLPILQSSPFAIIESNCILRHIRPDLYIMVLRCDVEDFKESARKTIGQAHAVVAVNCDSASPVWKDFARESLTGIPVFSTPDPLIIPPGLLEFVRSRIPNSKFQVPD